MPALKKYRCYWHKAMTEDVISDTARGAQNIMLQKMRVKNGDKLLMVEEVKDNSRPAYPY